ncbi:MAG: FAD-binding oxidoreductase [Sandaracinus sp.]
MRRIPALRRALRVVEATLAAPGVRRIVFETVDGAPYDFLAGQWVKLFLPGGIDRDYSIASAPVAGGGRLELLVTRVDGGPGSEALHAMAPGTLVESLGPSGLFVREDEQAELPALFVGTGSGVAPLRAMLGAMPEGRAPATLLFGCRTPLDVMFEDEWRARAARDATFRFEATLSRADERWGGRRGYVQTHLRELLGAMPDTTHVYVCGLTKMITEVRRVLKEELGVDRRRVHSERYD